MTTKTRGRIEQISLPSGLERWEVSCDRLERDPYNQVGDPVAVLSPLYGTQLTGTTLSTDADADLFVVELARGAVFWHNVVNISAYGTTGAPLIRSQFQEGVPVYYDHSPVLMAGTCLSLSSLDSGGTTNPRFGFVVSGPGVVYPCGSNSAESIMSLPVIQM